MTFLLTEDQEMLRDTAMAFARDELPVTHLRALRDSFWTGDVPPWPPSTSEQKNTLRGRSEMAAPPSLAAISRRAPRKVGKFAKNVFFFNFPYCLEHVGGKKKCVFSNTKVSVFWKKVKNVVTPCMKNVTSVIRGLFLCFFWYLNRLSETF